MTNVQAQMLLLCSGFEERGGWLNLKNIPAFVSYCSLILQRSPGPA
jgi:hypothetical protein